MRQLILVVHNVRSSLNVGSLLRTAEGLGVNEVWLTGYSPYPPAKNDERLPHIRLKAGQQISKTALGAENYIRWRHFSEIESAISELQTQGYTVAALEQAAKAIELPDFEPPENLALIVGREVEGLEPEVLAVCDLIIEIPMFGRKESFNVAVAAAIALYHLRFTQ